MSIKDTALTRATIVADERRQDFLPDLFGRSLLIVAENTIYSIMERLSPLDYRGGFWDFHEYDGKPLFLAPKSEKRFRITDDITGFCGEVSAQAAGIITTLFAFSHLSFKYWSDRLADGYERLYAYAADHPEAVSIFQAID